MSELIFLSTKAKIESRSKHHQFHSSLAVKDANSKIMIDFGIEHILSSGSAVVYNPDVIDNEDQIDHEC